MRIVIGVLLICLGVVLYFVPTMIAFKREKDNIVTIFAINFFLGWIVYGWVLAFHLAMARERKQS